MQQIQLQGEKIRQVVLSEIGFIGDLKPKDISHKDYISSKTKLITQNLA